MRHLQKLYVKYESKGLVILGFDASDDKKIALEMMRENDVTFPNILDSSDAAMKVCFQEYQGAYGSAVPMSYIIDREGKVVDAWYGYENGEPKAIDAMYKAGGELAKSVRPHGPPKPVETADTIAASAERLFKSALPKVDGEPAENTHRDVRAMSAESADAVAAAAQQLFQAIRAADCDRDWSSNDDWKLFPAKDVDYHVNRDASGWVSWVCKKFKANPIAEVQLGKVFAGPDGSPTVHFELRLKDGEILQGDLPFHWNSERKQWIGWEGLDWHLPKKP